jgi:N-acetylmuramoyl-L-alanine amidase
VKKYVIVFVALMLSACQNFMHVKTTVIPNQVIVNTIAEESELDRALPILLANVEQTRSPVTHVPILSSLPAPQSLPEAIDVVDPEEPKSQPFSNKDLDCLAVNIYHESRAEPERGQAAVAWVVVNRAKSGRYPPTICGVVYQRYRNTCQFSWVCDRRPDTPKEQQAYERSKRIAEAVLSGKYHNPIGTRMSFHATSIQSRYSARSRSRMVVGRHLFY